MSEYIGDTTTDTTKARATTRKIGRTEAREIAIGIGNALSKATLTEIELAKVQNDVKQLGRFLRDWSRLSA